MAPLTEIPGKTQLGGREWSVVAGAGTRAQGQRALVGKETVLYTDAGDCPRLPELNGWVLGVAEMYGMKKYLNKRKKLFKNQPPDWPSGVPSLTPHLWAALSLSVPVGGLYCNLMVALVALEAAPQLLHVSLLF